MVRRTFIGSAALVGIAGLFGFAKPQPEKPLLHHVFFGYSIQNQQLINNN